MLKGRRLKISLLVTIALFCVTLIVGVLFAYYSELHKGWAQDITSTNIVFKLNDKNVGTITNYDLELITRGEAKPLDFKVSIKGSRGMATYSLDLSLPDSITDEDGTTYTGQQLDQSLAPAIEVHEKQADGSYEYLCMLNEFVQSGIRGKMPINTERTLSYLLVYSEGAGVWYEGKGFTLMVTADSGIASPLADEIFVYNAEDIENAVAQGMEAYAGKTFILLNNITIGDGIEKELYFADKASIDLNGFTLTVSENTQFGYNYTTSNFADQIMGIIDSVGGGKVEVQSGGYLIIDTPNDAPCIFDGSVSGNLYIRAYSADAVKNAVELNALDIAHMLLQNGDEVDFIEGFRAYTKTGSFTVQSQSLPLSVVLDESLSPNWLVYNAATDKYNLAAAEAFTSVKSQFISISGRGVELSCRILGTSAVAIADNLMAKLPGTGGDVIKGSIFLPVYLVDSKATLTWISEEPLYLTADGVYLPNGYLDLPSWEDKTFRLGVIVDVNGEQHYARTTITVEILTVAERTELVYNYDQLIFQTIGETYSLDNSLMQNYLSKVGLTNMEVEFTTPAENIDETGLEYLSINNEGDYPIIELRYKPSMDRSVDINLNITFNYAGGSHTLTRKATVVGYRASEEIVDITALLQRDLDNSDYVLGTAYEFTVRGASDNGSKVDYFVDDPYREYINIKNDIYEKQTIENPNGGYYIANGGDYEYSSRYTKTLIGNQDFYIEAAGGEYILIDGNYVLYSDYFNADADACRLYNRLTRIRVLPAKVPTVRETTAQIYAKIQDASSPSGYSKEADGITDRRFNLSLVIKGVYHNNAQEIEDTNLYNKLVEIFDKDNDGWIQIDEASVDWAAEGIGTSIRPSGSLTINNVIDLSNLRIESLKGIEYFTGAKGLRLSNDSLTAPLRNNIKDLSYLSSLYQLEYLNLQNNIVTDITPLSYLDSLKAIILQSNHISSIEAIRYLPNVQHLNVRYNPLLTDFSPVAEYKNVLKYLDIRQNDETVTNNQNVAYFMHLIKANNSDAVIYRNESESSAMTLAGPYIAAAAALDQLVVIDEAYTTLSLPNTYVVRENGTNVTYNIEWTVNTTGKGLEIIQEPNGGVAYYRITTPIVNQDIEIQVGVSGGSGSSVVSGQMSRVFTLTLLKGENPIYIEISDDVFVSAEAAVPDKALLSLLFDSFNPNTTGTVTINGSAVSNENVLTIEERTGASLAEANFANKGIKDLSGIQYFNAQLTGSLNLSGNVLKNADLTPLQNLTNLKSLTLSGQEYDFTQLIPESGSNTGLLELNIEGCHGLDTDKVLSELYRVYLAYSNADIKFDNTTAWDPYSIPLSLYAQSIPDTFVFTERGETHSFYEAGQTSFSFRFYAYGEVGDSDYYEGNEINFTVNYNSKYGASSGKLEQSGGVITYNTLAGFADTVYFVENLTGTDQRQTQISKSFYVECKLEFNYLIVVDDILDENGQPTALERIFPGRTLRNEVVSKLPILTKGEDGRYHITKAVLEGLTFATSGRTIEGTYVRQQLIIDGTNSGGDGAIGGLRYLPQIKYLYILRDADLGTGEDLQHIEHLTISYSGVDFTTLTVDELPNLKILVLGVRANNGNTAGNRYSIFEDALGNNYLTKLTGLTHAFLMNSRIYNWGFLDGFMTEEQFIPEGETEAQTRNVTKLVGLRIYNKSTNNNDYPNGNLAADGTVDVATQLYNAAINSGITPDYHIGSPTSTTNTQLFDPANYDVQVGVTHLETTITKEYNEFAPSIPDLGVKVNGDYYFKQASEITSGGTIYLPKSTAEFYAGVNGSYFTNGFAINWRVAGLNNATLSAIFSGEEGLLAETATTFASAFGGGTDAYTLNLTSITGEGITLTAQTVTADRYLIFEGTIGSNYYDKDGNFVNASLGAGRVFYYPILIKAASEAVTEESGNTSFASFTDEALRFELLAVMLNEGLFENGIITTNDLTTFTTLNFAEAASVSYTNGTEKTINFSGYGNAAAALSIANRIYSLDGIGLFGGLTALNASNNYITDISDLSSAQSVLSVLNLSGNLISDISALGQLESLEEVDLSKNLISNILKSATETYFDASAATLSTLRLDNNMGLSEAQLVGFVPHGASPNTVSFNAITQFGYSGTTENNVLSYSTYNDLRQMLSGKASTEQVSFILCGNTVSLSYDELYLFCCEFYPALSAPSGINKGSNISEILTNGVEAVNSTWLSTHTTAYGTEFSYALTNAENINAYIGTSLITNLNVSATFSGKTITASVPISFRGTGYTNYTTYKVSGSDNVYNVADLDPAIWAYLTKTAATIDNGVIILNPTEVVINTNLGITSLNGLQSFPNLATVSVKNNNLTELWDSTFASLTNLTLSGTLDAAAINTAISQCANLTTLDLRGMSGVDYNNAALKATITASRITRLYYNTDMLVSDKANAKAMLLSLYANVNKTRTVATSVFYSTSSSDNFIQLHEISPVLTEHTTYSLNRFYDAAATENLRNGHENLLRRLAFILPNDNQDIRPYLENNLYEYAIRQYGILYDLPDSFTYYGRTINLTWTTSETGIISSTTGDQKFELALENYDSSWETIVLRANDSTQITFTIAKAAAEVAYRGKSPTYFLENADGTIIMANTVIVSTNLLEWLFNDCRNLTNYIFPVTRVNGNYVERTADNQVLYGYCISHTGRQITSFGTVPSKGITTLAGIDVAFPGLTSIDFTTGSFIDISPLASYQLTSFKYTNSDGTNNYFILDFAPLLNSKNTLTSFTYISEGNANTDDLSFLMGFGSQLTTISLYSAYAGTATGYLNMPSFRYMVAWFENNRPNTKISINGATTVPSIKDSAAVLRESAIYKKAAEVMSAYSGLDSDFSYVDDYQLVLKSSIENGKYYLPSLIDYGGAKYAVNYTTMSTFINNGNIVFEGKIGTTYSFDELSLNNGDILSYAELITLSQNLDFLDLLYKNEVNVHTEAYLVDLEYNNLANGHLVVRCEIDGYTFERTLFVKLK